MRNDARQMYSTWENALGLLRTEIPEEMIPVFLAQLGCRRYSSWTIASLWGMSAYNVSSYRRALCKPSLELVPEVRSLAADITLVQIQGRKTA